MEQPHVVWDAGALLGEGPVWDARDGALWFVDIKSQHIHRVDPDHGAATSWPAPAQIGWIVPAQAGGFVAGLQDGLRHFDPADGRFTLLASVEPHLPTNRLNDATVAPDGSIWFGTMDDGEQHATGRWYRWDGADVTDSGVPPVTITNGPAFSPDGSLLYCVDTQGGLISAVPVNAQGMTGAPRPFVQIDPADGHPDGVVTDRAGNVWLGLWGGSCARCYSPDGALLRQVDLPAANITKIALGGADGCTAFATTARIGLDAAALDQQPLAGALFSFAVDIPGQPLPLARRPA